MVGTAVEDSAVVAEGIDSDVAVAVVHGAAGGDNRSSATSKNKDRPIINH